MDPQDGTPDEELEEAVKNGRMCIVSRQSMPAEALIRFVADPDGRMVPDLKRKLPGRGVHVEGRREVVDLAAKRGLFRRALKREVAGTETLAADTDALLRRSLAGALGLARKAGQIVTGSAKVEAQLRSGRALALIHARDGAPDGIRKLDAARHAGDTEKGGAATPVYRLVDTAELDLALGGANVVHAAVLSGNAGSALLRRLEALRVYRGESAGTVDRKGAECAVPATVSNE